MEAAAPGCGQDLVPGPRAGGLPGEVVAIDFVEILRARFRGALGRRLLIQRDEFQHLLGHEARYGIFSGKSRKKLFIRHNYCLYQT